MVVLISGGLKNKIRSFRLFEKGQWILNPDPYNHTRHKENPQPSPITTSIPGKVNQVVTVLNCTCISWDVLYLQATPFRWDILTYLGQNIKANTSLLSSTIPQELRPFLSTNFSFSHIKLFMTTQPCSIFPSSLFSSPTSPSAMPFVPAVTTIFWLLQNTSLGIVLHSFLDAKHVPELTHKPSIFFGINSSSHQWWWQLIAISRM